MNTNHKKFILPLRITIFKIRSVFSETNKRIKIFALGGLIIGLALFLIGTEKSESELLLDNFPDTPNSEQLVLLQDNSLLPISNPLEPDPQVVKKIPMIVTAYSSTIWETDDNPFLTAAGTLVKEGIVANNLLPFGTKVKMPEIYGDKVFIVEDRMHHKKGYYHIDIWFPSYWEAKNFGAKRTYVEILES